MKILMVAPTPFFADRGCHTRIYEEVLGLQGRGHEVLLCTYGLGRDMPEVKTARCVNMPWYKKLSAGPSLTKILLLPFLWGTTMRQIGRFKPDVVHAHLHEGAMIAYFCRWFKRKPAYLFDMQGSLTGELIGHKFIREKGFRFSVFSGIERMLLKRFQIVTSSEKVRAQAIELGRRAPESVVNVMDGVNTSRFAPQQPDPELAASLGVDLARPRVLYMGLLETYQGTDVMLEAFAMMKAALPMLQFLIIGFPNVEHYRAVAQEKGIGEDVLFLGKVDYMDIHRYLALATVAVAPKISPTESDGKVYNYMAMGMATVAFRRNATQEILGDAGLYANLNDPGDLAEKLLALVNHPDEAAQWGQKARNRAMESLSWSAVARRLEDVYQGMLHKK